MATRTKLPAVTSNIMDYGLGVAAEPAVLNDSILIIGTASDGPMYEPIPVLNKDQAIATWGSFGDGTLVRGIYESFDATIEGTPDIRGMRIGNGAKAFLEVAERLSSSHPSDAVTTAAVALKLEAIFEGSKYNAISIWLDESKYINVYNPKTGQITKISYDDTNPYNQNVDARNVSELADVINNDPNLSSVVVASVSGLQASFEIEVNTASSGVSVINGKAILDMPTILYNVPGGDILPTGYIYDPDVTETAGNLIDELEDVFSISISEPSLLEIKGLTNIKTELMPFDGKNDARFDTIQALEDYNADDRYMHSPTGSVISEYVSYLDREVLTDVTQAYASGAFAMELSINGLYEAPDDHQEVTSSGSAAWNQTCTTNGGVTDTTSGMRYGNVAHAWAAANSGSYYSAGYLDTAFDSVDSTIANYVKITCSGFDEYLQNPGQIIVELSTTNGTSDSDWTPLFYHPISGIYISGFACTDGTGVITLAIGTEAASYSGEENLVDAGLITSSGTTVADRYLRVSCTTCKGFLTEVPSLPALEAVGTDWRSYFVRGNEMVFANTVPVDLVVNYGTKVSYEPGSDILIDDSANGKLKFVSDVQPGPGGEAIDATKKSIIGFKYKYLPQFPAISTVAQSLAGGTNGTEMTNETLYDEFETAYNALENYNVQIVVPMGANIDATKESYNSITGLPETVNCDFQTQLHTMMDNLAVNVNEGIAIMGVETADSTTLANVSDWVKRLTVQDSTDPNRGANIMPFLDSRYISVAAFEPIFSNIGGLAYTANGQAAYAGMISSLQPHDSPTNKSIPSSLRTRFSLSNSQLEALLDARYVAMRNKPGRSPVISSAITAAAAGSDFTRLTTVRITFAAMDVVRKVCDPFIGQPNSQAKRNAMEAAITKGLQGLVDVGALRKFAFTVSSSATQQVLGIVDVDLILVPVFEIQQIRVTVKLRTEIPAA